MLAIVLSVLLQGCAALKAVDFLMPAKDGLSVDAELTVGDKQEDVNTQLGDRSTQQASTINNVNDIPISWVLLFTILAGWAIPSPGEMGKGIILFMRTLFIPWSKK